MEHCNESPAPFYTAPYSRPIILLCPGPWRAPPMHSCRDSAKPSVLPSRTTSNCAAPTRAQACTQPSSSLHPPMLKLAPTRAQACTHPCSSLHPPVLKLAPTCAQACTHLCSSLHPPMLKLAPTRAQACTHLCSSLHPPVSLLKVALQLLNDALQLDLEHIVLFTVTILDLLALRLKVLQRHVQDG